MQETFHNSTIHDQKMVFPPWSRKKVFFRKMFENCPTRITTAVLQIGKSYLLCLQQFAKFFGFQEKRRCINVCFSFGGRPQNVLVVFGFFLSKSFSGKGLEKVAKKENVLRYFRSIFLLKKKVSVRLYVEKYQKESLLRTFFKLCIGTLNSYII